MFTRVHKQMHFGIQLKKLFKCIHRFILLEKRKSEKYAGYYLILGQYNI